MAYVGLQAQIQKNNIRSVGLLLSFPLLLLGMCWLMVFAVHCFADGKQNILNLYIVNYHFFKIAPFIIIAVILWFTIASFFHKKMILRATSSKPMERMENKRVYNLVENLCISQGMATIPSIYIIDDDSLNAFACGISSSSYSISLSTGIINKLDDEELKAVIAHELTHIQNCDTRTLIISIIFVGIFAFIAEMILRGSAMGGGDSDDGEGWIMLVCMILISGLAYLVSLLIRYAISRQREYMADAGSVEMTKNSNALATALQKISNDCCIEAVKRKDVAQLFIENPAEESTSKWQRLFSTHPPIEKRIAYLEHL